MDLKITFDVTPALADVAKSLCRALELRSTHTHAFHCAAAHVEPQKADAPAKAENSPVEAPEPVDAPKPAPAPENAADAKSEAVAVQIDEPAPEPVQVEPQAEQSTEPQAEQSTEPEPEPAPVEAPKAKRSHHKKAAPEPALSPEPVQVAEPEPQPEPEPQVEPAPAEPAPAEPVLADTPNAPTIDDVRAVGVKLGAAGKQSVIIDYLKAHGCKSLSQLDPGCYAELIEIGRAAL
jgi:hypothetical protein